MLKLDSAFQLQEHLKALHYHHTRPSNGNHTIPINRTTAKQIAEVPEGVDRNLWLYELCRFLINKCNDLIVGFFNDDPPCSATTCPEMRASEWQFLCAVHEAPKSCCAIDYCCHTLDWAAGIVTSQKHFPSRLSLGGGVAMDEGGNNVKHLVNIFRRLHRIFAHAWFQHMGVFWQVEGQTGLYVLFKTVCDRYELLPAENYKLPPEAEGLEAVKEVKGVPTILKAEAVPTTTKGALEPEDPAFMSVNRTNTRRHIRSSPSTGSAVTTVLEAEEDETDVSSKLGAMQLNDTSSQPISTTTPVDEDDTDDSEVESEADITIMADGEDLENLVIDHDVDDESEEIPVAGLESPTLPSGDIGASDTGDHEGQSQGGQHLQGEDESRDDGIKMPLSDEGSTTAVTASDGKHEREV